MSLEVYITFSIFILLILFFIWLGWRIRRWWKNFLFSLSKRRGRIGESEAIEILMRSGYKIIDDQVRIKGQFYIDSKSSEFEIRPDFIVEKNNIRYLVEVKTGNSASPSDRHTRRQLLEYIFYGEGDEILLLDATNKKLSTISFNT